VATSAASAEVRIDAAHALHPRQAFLQFGSARGLKHGHEHVYFAMEV